MTPDRARHIWQRNHPLGGAYACTRRTLLLSILALFGSCSIKMPVRPIDVALPANKRLGLSVGYFVAPEMKSYETRIPVEGGNEVVFPVGAQSTSTFEAMFSKLFLRSGALPARPSETSPAQDADAAIEPRLEGVSIKGPQSGVSAEGWNVALQYLFLFSDSAGHPIAYWHVGAVGHNTQGIIQDWIRQASEAFGNAFLDLEQRFLDGFAKVPEVRAWLEAKGVSES